MTTENANLAAAIVAAQSEMPSVQMDATNPFLHNKYASLGAVIEVSRPVLAKHGLAVIQFPESNGNTIAVRTRLVHRSGEFAEGTVGIEQGEEKGKSRAQVAGSIITYLRRYSLASVLGMYADEDGDGNTPAPKAKPAPPAAAPASAPKPSPATPKSDAVPQSRKDRFLEMCKIAGGGSLTYATEVLRSIGVIADVMDACDIDDAPGDATWGDILEQIRKSAGNEPPPEGERVTGEVAAVAEKSGKKKDGTPWTRYGIKVGEVWFNTFSKTIGEQLKAAKGKSVTLVYTETTQGDRVSKDIVAVE